MLINILAEIKLLGQPSLSAVHQNLLVATRCHNAVTCPAQGVWWAGMNTEFALGVTRAFIIKEVAYDRAVGMTRQDTFARITVEIR